MRFILTSTVALAFCLSLLTACQDAASPVNVESAKATNSNSVAVTPKANEPKDAADDAPRIALAEAKKDFDAGNTVFVDTRAEAAYKQEHIKGSINVPIELFEAKYKDIPTGKKIIAYCSWPSEHTSAGLVAKLKEKGIGNAYALVGGTNAWKSANYPMDKSEVK